MAFHSISDVHKIHLTHCTKIWVVFYKDKSYFTPKISPNEFSPPPHTHTHTHSHSSSPSREDWKLTSSFAFQGWEGAGDAADNFLLTCPWRLDHWGPMKWFYALSVLEGAGRKTAILVRSTTKTSECKQVQENFPQESLRNVLPQVPKGDGHPSPWGRMKS